MGAGKTTIGRLLAKQLGLTFYDSDREIEKRTGAPISLIFELEQESGFRKRECIIIDELTQLDDIVLATGGGAILDEENRHKLSSRGHVIYLYATIEQLLKRTSRDKNRPLLQTADPGKKLEDLMSIREPLYREVAHTIVETGNSPVKHVVNDLLNILKDK